MQINSCHYVHIEYFSFDTLSETEKAYFYTATTMREESKREFNCLTVLGIYYLDKFGLAQRQSTCQ